MNIGITGTGVVASIGNDTQTFWDQLLEGQSGRNKIRGFDVSEHRNQFGCEIDDIPTSHFFDHEMKQMGRATNIVMPALEEAWQDANLTLEDFQQYKVGVCVGTTMGEIEPLEKALRHEKDNPMMGGPHAIIHNMEQLISLQGPKWTFTNACAAGNFAIARCMEALQSGHADIMIALGVDAMSWVAFTGFSSLRAMSNDHCSPFQQDRKGLLLGEGAGVLILEREDHYRKRKVKSKAHVLGYGFNCDAHHITQPDPNAKGAVRAMREALAMANVSPEQIQYVSAHGTGTMANDRMESKAIQHLLEGSQHQIAMSSIKGHIGHTLGAASAIEAIMCTKALETGLFPQTANLKKVDEQCQCDEIQFIQQPMRCESDVVLSNAYAFGGINSSIVLSTSSNTDG
ncbi:beta-ketoacyl-[acyl-carrier-protein] synthase family protein [Longirhabdus pacifica]|uniref:beta-ketoacyl-[acyl-carrier-protein] synthase family protein n=1 Tax=Longirhabdus pacifica TaxID=2305227 RepID=UPI0010087F0B|nr:beta-ketoacyl-[acyl-carrier-protein] synthase family protein [Longirhabdus pacifica]